MRLTAFFQCPAVSRWLTVALLLAIGLTGSPRLPATSAVQQPGPAQAQAASESQGSLERLVSFRDGTRLRVDFPPQQLAWRRVQPSGEITDQPLPMQRVQRIDLVREPATASIAQVRKLITALGASQYKQRAEAHAKLIELGEKYRPVLAAVAESADSEARWRIEDVLRNLGPGTVSLQHDLDRITLAGESDVVRGELGQAKWSLTYRGQSLELDREKVLSITAEREAPEFSAAAGVAQITAYRADDPRDFPQGTYRVGFELDANGDKLAVGDDVARAYVGAGVTFETSVTGTKVSVQPYKVRQGQSAATHDPPYTGTITARFCLPGNPRLPAHVHFIGCWLSYISPEGTSLQAFDAQDRLLGEVTTQNSGAEFIALRSSLPIAYCRIRPDESVDADYAFDEFLFDTPRPLLEAGDPEWFTVQLWNGERLQAKQIVSAADQLTLSELSIGVPSLTLNNSEIAVLIPPADAGAAPQWTDLPWVRMKQGSTFRAKPAQPRGLQITRFADQGPVDIRSLASLWGAEQRPIAVSDAAPAPFLEWKQQRMELEGVSLGATWIESPALSNARGELEFTYQNSPFVWLAAAQEIPPQAGLLRTVEGETIVLTPQTFRIAGWDTTSVQLQWDQVTFEIPWPQIQSLRFPPPR